jgi:hypothetical protein
MSLLGYRVTWCPAQTVKVWCEYVEDGVCYLSPGQCFGRRRSALSSRLTDGSELERWT